MKKVLLLLVVTLAFTFTAMAQTESKTGGTSEQTTTTKAKKSKKGSAASETGHAAGAAKEATVTGCLSAQPDSNGNYTLTNGRYKKGVEVTPADKVKEHAGHQVKLTGNWTAEAAGEQPGGAKKKGKKAFEVASLTHISDTCAKASGGATSEKPAGKTAEAKPKKEKKSGDTTTPPPKM